MGARKEWGASAYPPPELADHLWRLKEQVAAAHWQRTRGSYDYATENELWFLQCQHACHLLFFCSHEWAGALPGDWGGRRLGLWGGQAGRQATCCELSLPA